MRKTENWRSLILALALILGGLLNLIAWADAQAETYNNATRSGNTDLPNERWQGTINVTGDITIATGSTLTIDPGTIVKFAAGSDDQGKGPPDPIRDQNFPHDPAIAPSTICSINVFGGTLIAIGTPDNRILFTSSATNPQPGDWESIQYILTNSTLRLQYAILEYGYYGVGISTPDTFNATDAYITINNNIMRDIVACGVCCGNSRVSITVSNNDMSSCGHEGIDTHGLAKLVIENNVFHDIYNHIDGPTGAGVIIDGNSSIVRNNTFERSRFGINLLNGCGTPSIYGNVFVDNYADFWGSCPPGAPKAVKARAVKRSAVVSFEPQPSPFLNTYIVTSSPGNITETETYSPINVTGLNNGTAYRFTVSAVNWFGTGPASDFSNSVTPGGTRAPLMLLLD